MPEPARRDRRRRVPRTKLAVPRLPPQLVSRPRLLSRLDGALDALVTLVSASAGTGKTLLLAEWVHGRDSRDTAWVSLDSDDNDEDRFWSALLEALSGCESVPRDNPLRGGLALPEAPSSDPRFLAELVNTLDELPAPVLLVLDDVHELTDPRPLHGLESLLRHHPAGLRLVLAARHDPGLPLGRLRLTDQLTEVRAEDLRFSPDEARALLEAAGLDLDADQLGSLVEQTEGWAAGLRLAALSLAETDEPARVLDDLAANDRVVGGYLVDEVLSRLPAGLGEFLTTISVCEQVSAPLAAELSGRADAGAVLDSLTRLTSLVTTVESARDSYHVHVLLRSHLLADLSRHAPERAARLHGAAAGWFAGNGRPALAMAHAVEAQDADLACDLARRFAATLVLDGDHDLVRELLDVVGPLVAEDSGLALVSALLHLEHGDTVAADRDLANVETAWPADVSAELSTMRRLVLARRAQLGGDVNEQLLATEQLEHGHEADPLLDALARLYRGTALLAASRHSAAREHLSAAFESARDHGHEYLETQCVSILAALASTEGDYRRMATLAEDADRRNSRHGWQRTVEAAMTDVLRGYGALLAADPATSLRYVTRAVRGPRLLVETVRGAAEFELGDWTGGARRIERAPNTEGSAGSARLPAGQVALTAVLGHRAALLLGWGQTAGQLLDWAQANVPAAGEIHLMRARAQLALGRHYAVGKIICPLLDGTSPVVVPWSVIEAWLLTCEAALNAGDREPATRALRKALAAAERLEVLHPVVFARSDVVDLLTANLGKLGGLDPFAERALATLRALDLPPLPVPLTPRERGILRMLPTARSLDEIAKDLTVSPNTVKTHVRAIYAKLGVTRRRDAVEVAAERGLLAEATIDLELEKW
jgi:LuxR family transcriptional regulator, maltose regulon positive regulatory protein